MRREAFYILCCIVLPVVSRLKGDVSDPEFQEEAIRGGGIIGCDSGAPCLYSRGTGPMGRRLAQEGETTSACSLSKAIVDAYFSAADNTWRVTAELLEETDGELQPVVECASSGAIVVISSGLEIEISDRIEIETAIAIEGEGNDRDDYPTLTCAAGNQIVDITRAEDVALRRLNVVDCNPGGGDSPIEIQNATVTIDDCHFIGNQGETGGVVDAQRGASVTITDCSFVKNAAKTGGAIAFDEDSVGDLINSTFRNNQAANGGAVYLYNDTTVKAEGCTFERNRGFSYGGAVYVRSATAKSFLNWNRFTTTLRFEMTNCVCSNNRALLGGCVAMFNESILIVKGTVFEGNKVEGQGGGIYGFRTFQTVLEDLRFVRNKALSGGGIFFNSSLVVTAPLVMRSIGRAVVVSRKCAFRSNNATFGGAVMAIDAVSFQFANCQFDSNTADAEGSAVGSGGAILLVGSAGYDQSGSVNSILGVGSFIPGANTANLFRSKSLKIIANVNSSDTLVVPMGTVELTGVNFTNNHASGFGGALVVQSGCAAYGEDVRFENNSADHVGAAYAFQSMFFCLRCLFFKNSAVQSGGAVAIQGVPSQDHSIATLAEGYLRDVVFEENKSGYYGGALLVDGLSAFLYLLGNVTLTDNQSGGGGAIVYEIGAVMEITDARIANNRATVGGGAISMTFVQFRTNSVKMKNVVMANNTAPKGGAIHALYNVQTADTERPRIEFGGTPVRPSLTMDEVIVENNTATEGGALYADGVPGLLINVTLRGNNATGRGGGVIIQDGSVMKVIDGSFLFNKGGYGGGLMIDERSMLHCVECDIEGNTATEHGGGTCVTTQLYKPQPVAFQCDSCRFRSNVGTRGGGLHVGYGDTGIDPKDDALIILRGVEFEDNVAEVGGGAIMAGHPQNILFSCEYNATSRDRRVDNIHLGFVDGEDAEELSNLRDDEQCPSWTNNIARRHGYGGTKAGYVSYASARYMTEDGTTSNGPAVITRTERVPKLPLIHIVLYDEFDQFPAEARIEHPNLIVNISSSDRGVEFSGQLRAFFERGEAVLDGVIVRGPPGRYTLLLTFSDRTKREEVELEIQRCPIGWTSVTEDTDCDPCEAGTYNFDPTANNCPECPDHGTCRTWGIEPQADYWQPFPCNEEPTECLTEHACDFGGREEALRAFLRNTTATCHLSEEDLQTWRDLQCNSGHKGLLCGSCRADYGRRGLACRRCYAKGVVVFLLFLALGWFLFVVTVATKGNLNSTRQRQRRRVAPPHETRRDHPITPAEQPTGSSPLAAGVTTNGQPNEIRVEMPTISETSDAAPTSHARAASAVVSTPVTPRETPDRRSRSAESSMPAFNLPPTRQERPVQQETKADATARETLDRYELLKRTLAETFKLLINYLQVTAMALTINVRWTVAARRSLQLIDFLGAFAGEAALSLDCLFSESSSVPRSISREILFLMVPFMLLAVCGLYWWRIMRASPEVRNRRLKLSAVVIFYVSYIGITRRLIRILYCIKFKDGTSPTNIFSERYWTEDTAVECYTGSHAWLVGLLVVPMIVLLSVAFPVASAYVLIRQRRDGQLYREANRETFGFMFRGYRDDYVFWDSVIMLRKALLALVVGFGYPLGPTLQGAIASFILFVSVMIQMYLHPFDDQYGFLNHLETFSLGISANTYISGIILNEENLKQGGRVFVSFFVILFLFLFVAACVGYMFLKASELMRLDLEEDGKELEEDDGCMRVFARWSWERFFGGFSKFAGVKRPSNKP